VIRWTATSIRHLTAIHDRIAADNPAAAARQCRLIYEAVTHLDRFPHAGRSTNAEHNRRFAVSGTPYLVFYRITAEAIFIRAIWHGAQLPPPL
jgi:plasmid stabilization system protein ParE